MGIFSLLRSTTNAVFTRIAYGMFSLTLRTGMETRQPHCFIGVSAFLRRFLLFRDDTLLPEFFTSCRERPVSRVRPLPKDTLG